MGNITTQAELRDSFGRQIKYLRLSVTDKCNLRCFYCLPKGFKNFEEPENWLSFEETERLLRAFSELGVRHIRITGGEPMVRKNLAILISRLSSLPSISELSMSTNATLLDSNSELLFNSGLQRLNISLDTLDPARFKRITGGGNLGSVLNGIDAALKHGLTPIKINMVAMKGINDDEFVDMARFCMARGITLRFIETMPMGDSGRIGSLHYLPLQEVEKQLENFFDLIPSQVAGSGPARYMRVQGTRFNMGFITPISRHFCESCNRVRLSVDGTLYLCLGDDYKFEFRPLLRNGISDAGLKDAIHEAIAIKPERHYFVENPEKPVRFMSMTGG